MCLKTTSPDDKYVAIQIAKTGKFSRVGWLPTFTPYRYRVHKQNNWPITLAPQELTVWNEDE